MAKFDWNELERAKMRLVKRAEAMKRAFVQMPGGMQQGGDPSMGGGDPSQGGAPMDPSMAGGMPPGGDPSMSGGMPMDPSMMGGMPPPGDPSMGGAPMDPAMMAMMGGQPPMGVDPATAGMLPGMPGAPADAGAGGAAAGAAGAGTAEPTLTLTLSQLWDVVTKVLGLAKKIGSNGQGVAAEAPQSSASSPDAIKTAVIEALSSMGAMKMAAANPANAGVSKTPSQQDWNLMRLEGRAHDAMVRHYSTKGAKPLDKNTQALLDQLCKAKGRQVRSWDSNKGFTWK